MWLVRPPVCLCPYICPVLSCLVLRITAPWEGKKNASAGRPFFSPHVNPTSRYLLLHFSSIDFHELIWFPEGRLRASGFPRGKESLLCCLTIWSCRGPRHLPSVQRPLPKTLFLKCKGKKRSYVSPTGCQFSPIFPNMCSFPTQPRRQCICFLRHRKDVCPTTMIFSSWRQQATMVLPSSPPFVLYASHFSFP